MVVMTAGTLAIVFRVLCLSMGCTQLAGRCCSRPATRSMNLGTERLRLPRLGTLVWESCVVVLEIVTAVAAVVAVHRILPLNPTNGIYSLAMAVVASFDHGCGI